MTRDDKLHALIRQRMALPATYWIADAASLSFAMKNGAPGDTVSFHVDGKPHSLHEIQPDGTLLELDL